MSSTDTDCVVCLRVKSHPRYLCVVRALVRTVAGLAGFDESRANAIVLAVDESCTNIIRHSYGGRADGDIELSASLPEDGHGGRVLLIRLRDFGVPLPAERLACPPAKDPLQPGGLGLHLIRCIMDSVEFDHSPEQGNVLQLSVACSPAE